MVSQTVGMHDRLIRGDLERTVCAKQSYDNKIEETWIDTSSIVFQPLRVSVLPPFAIMMAGYQSALGDIFLAQYQCILPISSPLALY